jgi:outer membrane immunogenic protein
MLCKDNIMTVALGMISATALAVASGTAAMAADMPLKAPPHVAPVAPAYNWTGCYVGGNVGYVWGTSDVTYAQTGAYLTVNPPADVAFANALGSPSIGMSGVTGGGQIGCNYQFGAFVIGLEGDGEYVGLSGATTASGTLPVLGSGVSSSVTVSDRSLFTVRPRIGYAFDRTLFYATGGWADGRVSYSQSFLHTVTGSVDAGTVSANRGGWTVGGGIEYALAYNWTIRGEYLYVNLGSVGFGTANNLFPAFTTVNSASFKESLVRFGLNYKF